MKHKTIFFFVFFSYILNVKLKFFFPDSILWDFFSIIINKIYNSHFVCDRRKFFLSFFTQCSFVYPVCMFLLYNFIIIIILWFLFSMFSFFFSFGCWKIARMYKKREKRRIFFLDYYLKEFKQNYISLSCWFHLKISKSIFFPYRNQRLIWWKSILLFCFLCIKFYWNISNFSFVFKVFLFCWNSYEFWKFFSFFFIENIDSNKQQRRRQKWWNKRKEKYASLHCIFIYFMLILNFKKSNFKIFHNINAIVCVCFNSEIYFRRRFFLFFFCKKNLFVY